MSDTKQTMVGTGGALTIDDVRAHYSDPEMEVSEHTLEEMCILLHLCSLAFVGGRRWAVHGNDEVWMGFNEQDALRAAMEDE